MCNDHGDSFFSLPTIKSNKAQSKPVSKLMNNMDNSSFHNEDKLELQYREK